MLSSICADRANPFQKKSRIRPMRPERTQLANKGIAIKNFPNPSAFRWKGRRGSSSPDDSRKWSYVKPMASGMICAKPLSWILPSTARSFPVSRRWGCLLSPTIRQMPVACTLALRTSGGSKAIPEFNYAQSVIAPKFLPSADPFRKSSAL